MIDYLKSLYQSIDLNERYTEGIDGDCPIQLPNQLSSNFEKNVYLKHNLKRKLDEDDTLSTHYWIIHKWGGIKNFKKCQRNDEKIRKFYEELKRKKLSGKSFDTISSLSKLSSFSDSENFFIYDARAIFALDWIIIKCESPDTQKLFPLPEGRNKKIKNLDLKTIVNLSNKKFSYYNPSEAYFKYCSLLQKVSSVIFPQTETFNLEMLLFVTSVQEIADDIRNTIKININ